MPLIGTALRMSPSAAAPGDPMTLVFDTSLEAGEQITLPLQGTVNCTVDWGDSSNDVYTTTGEKNHTYASGGTYTVKIYGTLTSFGDGSSYANSAKLTQCTSFGDIGLTSLVGAFLGATNLTVVPATLPSSITNLVSTFQSTSSFTQNLSGWDVSNVTNFTQCFFSAGHTGAGLSSWDLSGIAAAGGMTNFASGATFSTANYNAMLVAWEAAKGGYRIDLSPHFGNSTYTSPGSAATARAALETYGWTITDGGTA